jgi:organic radical activating enzyme
VSQQTGQDSYKNFEHWWHGNNQAQLRSDLVSGIKNIGCNSCWKAESLGKESLRQGYNKLLRKHADFDKIKQHVRDNNFHQIESPTTWELDVGNICNLKCVMCNPLLSNKIQKEVLDNVENFKDFPVLIESAQSVPENWSETDEGGEFIEKIKPNLQWLKLQGGEALSVRHIKNVIENVDSSQVTLAITTNGTVLDERLIQTLGKFKQVEISISVEAAESANDIIRYGSDWEIIKQNILKLKSMSNVYLQINHVLQITSVLYLPSLINFCEKHNLYLGILPLSTPHYLGLSACPPQLLKNLIDDIDKIEIKNPRNIPIKDYVKNCIKSTIFNTDHYEQFKKFTRTLDLLRPKKFSTVCKPILEVKL